MKTTRALADLGQSLWLDNITRPLLDSGTLARYIDELDVTGLTSNPTIYDRAIGGSDGYDAEIAEAAHAGKSGEDTFFEVALSDLRRAADLFRPVHDRTDGVDGFVSLEVSPLLAYDTAATVAQAKRLHAQGDRPNLFIKIPGTPEGLPAVEEAIVSGVPVNVTLLFSPGPVPRLRGGLHPGHRAARRGRPARVRRLGRVAVHQPLGPGHREAAPGRHAERAGPRHRPPELRGVREFFASERWQRLAAAGRAPAAPAVRQHRDQGPVAAADAVHHGPRRPGHRQHDARGDAPGHRRVRGGRRGPRRRTRRTSSRASPPPAWTSTPWPASSSARAPSPSWARWTSLLDRIAAKVTAVA